MTAFCANIHQSSTLPFQDAIKLIQQHGPGCFLAKTNIESAFKIVPIHPSDYHLLGLAWNSNFYYDKCLPFGCSSSCNIFETFSTALEWAAQNKLHIPGDLHLLDDFLFIAPSRTQSSGSLSSFIRMCALMGIPIACDRTFDAATILDFAGINLDTIQTTARLPADKIRKCKAAIAVLDQKKRVTLHQLQSVIGLLKCACSVIIPSRAFLHWLIDLMIGLTKPYHHVRLNKEARADLAAWGVFLDTFNGMAFFLDDAWVPNSHLRLYTDAAASLGYGAILGQKWFFGEWPDHWKHQNITLLEFFPILAAVIVRAPLLHNKRIMFYTDNMALVHVINNNTSKEPQIMVLVTKLVVSCMLNNIQFRATHVSGDQ